MRTKTRLGDCITSFIDHRGKTPAKMGGDWSDEGVRVISALNVHNGIIDNTDKIRCVSFDIYKKWMDEDIKRNDCLIASEGASLGENAIWDSDEKIVLGQRLYAIRTNPDILDPWFFAAYMQTTKFKTQIDQISTGSTVFGISQQVLLDIILLLPDIDEQRQIGDFYKKMLHKLVNNSQKISVLNNIIDDIYCFWFENYNFPSTDNKPYKENGGLFEYNDLIKRDIPKGWSVSPMLDLTYWETNSQPPKSEFRYEEKIGYIRFIQNRDYDSGDYLTFVPKTKSLSIANRYDILMDKYGDAGMVRYGIEGAFNVALAKIGVKKPNALEYIRCFLASKPIYEYLHNACMASTRASLSEDNIKPLYVVVPPDYLLDQFEEMIHSLRKSILNYKDENESIGRVKKEFLPLLMNGQASVK